jgi:hypothetical protein
MHANAQNMFDPYVVAYRDTMDATTAAEKLANDFQQAAALLAGTSQMPTGKRSGTNEDSPLKKQQRKSGGHCSCFMMLLCHGLPRLNL